MFLTNLFKRIGSLVRAGLLLAVGKGLTNEVIAQALALVRAAAASVADNAEKRQLVVDALVARGIPEGVARIALELALNLLKAEKA